MMKLLFSLFCSSIQKRSLTFSCLQPLKSIQCQYMQVGFTLSQATKVLRESRGTALLYFRPLHQKGVKGHCHAPAAPYPRERSGTHCTGGWVGLRAGLDRCGKSRPTGIRSPDRPARRQSLYRLRYPAHASTCYLSNISLNNTPT